MHLNADPAVAVTVRAAQLPWVPSPAAGVWRRMLSRIGNEAAQATSIVRYDPGSRFPLHTHPGGEEILVLEGVFQDESGDWPAGSYLRSPDGSSHTPASAGGCILFVKLRQFPAQDRQTVRMPPNASNAIGPLPASGHFESGLFSSQSEQVRVLSWGPDQAIEIANPTGLELLVLDGSLVQGSEIFQRLSWLRLPPSTDLKARSAASGCRVWIKTGHLAATTS